MGGVGVSAPADDVRRSTGSVDVNRAASDSALIQGRILRVERRPTLGEG
jgi:hypothetical protein